MPRRNFRDFGEDWLVSGVFGLNDDTTANEKDKPVIKLN
jgi:hypothetical protein